jgi:hypothetical protein
VAPETSRPGGQLATNNAAGLAASSDQPAGPQKGTTAATEVVAPTLISNWHFLHIISRQATLSHLSLHDTAEEPGGAWRELPSRAKLRARALSLLSHLRELTSLDLQVSRGSDLVLVGKVHLRWFPGLPGGRCTCILSAIALQMCKQY